MCNVENEEKKKKTKHQKTETYIAKSDKSSGEKR